MRMIAWGCILWGLVAGLGCRGRQNPEESAPAPPPNTPPPLASTAPTYEPPHGGTVIPGANAEFQLELLHDPARGEIHAYVLSPSLDQFVRLRAESIGMVVETGSGRHAVKLQAVANPATGEVVGDTSVFEASAPWLKEVTRFTGRIEWPPELASPSPTQNFSYPR